MTIRGHDLKWDSVRFTPGILARIEKLAQMDDRRMRLVAECDRKGLLRLAEEYRNFGCGMPKTASQIKRQAQRI